MKLRVSFVLPALVLVLMAVCAVIAFRQKAAPRRGLEMSFLHFTNTPAGWDACFAVTRPPRYSGCTWGTAQLDRFEGGEWRYKMIDGRGQVSTTLTMPPPGQRRTTHGQEFDLLGTFRVPNTNDSWRVRVRVQENALRPRFPWSSLEKFRRSGNFRARSGPDGPWAYTVTNEVRAESPAR